MAQHKMYLSYDWVDEKDAYLAVISYGQPQFGDEQVEVLTVKLLPTPKACRQWFKRMRKERPWEERH